MAASRFACHIFTDIDAKKSSMTKSLYRFYAGYPADMTCLGYIFPSLMTLFFSMTILQIKQVNDIQVYVLFVNNIHSTL